MELKRNDATNNRPAGDRVIDGSYVFINLPQYIDQLTSEKAWEKNDRNGITVFKAERMTVVLSALQKDASLDNNSVEGFLMIEVIKGSLRVTTPDGEVDLAEKQMLVLHPKIDHSIKAVADSYVLITNHSTSI